MELTMSLFVPIPPLIDVQTGRVVDATNIDEPLVDLARYSKGLVRCSPQYGTITAGVSLPCLARRSVADRLVSAHSLLPKGLRFLVYDAWRPLEIQQRLFDEQLVKLLQEHPDWPESVAQSEASRFVTNPSEVTPPHSTGGAVDLTLSRSDGDALWCGSAFDEFSPESATRYFEEAIQAGRHLSPQEREAMLNRRVLYNSLARVGMTNYPREWWHFDYGDGFWSQVVGKPAVYGPTSYETNV
jgi:D-alanyl-D-alanine dipeptidase